ncbi:hypothetical protein SPTER_32720 [Sporomusa termitida]|uniref:Uncharacterized protein n=1 Tax=Sporomusa termitida TaxID=2377 RepID=A0A517DWX2_9FIRM|nr:hypothetical protein SPTER_32720 [Sporomusa termitida]
MSPFLLTFVEYKYAKKACNDSREPSVTTEKVNIKTDFLQYIENEIILDNYI